MRAFYKSVSCAARGILTAILGERNMRIHCVAAVYVSVFAIIAKLSRSELAILALTFAVVMSAEIFNTAVERMADASAEGYSNVVKVVKDLASGAVLITAIGAVSVGVALFGRLKRIHFVISVLAVHPLWIIALVISLVFAILFIAKGLPFIIKNDKLRMKL